MWKDWIPRSHILNFFFHIRFQNHLWKSPRLHVLILGRWKWKNLYEQFGFLFLCVFAQYSARFRKPEEGCSLKGNRLLKWGTTGDQAAATHSSTRNCSNPSILSRLEKNLEKVMQLKNYTPLMNTRVIVS